MKYDTVCFLGFAIQHDTKEPDVLENVRAIRLAILNRLARMTDKEILSEIEFGETIDIFEEDK
tara:strand:+ start:784 stop:972 length:189 start_codon:yes stop_codon:yes gene_type:complete